MLMAAFASSATTPAAAAARNAPGDKPLAMGPQPPAVSGTAAWSFEPDIIGANAGAAVATAGDVNGDGFSDVIVGAPNANFGLGLYPGIAYLSLGSANGLGAPIWSAHGTGASGILFGAAVACAGDVNGDGYDDVLIGAPNGQITSPCGAAGGSVYLYYGGPSGLQASWGWSAQLCGDQLAEFGSAVGTAGDVNGDGFDDIIVGAWSTGGLSASNGTAYVYYGSASGPGSSPNWTVNGAANERFGISVGTAGDVNGDGYADVVVGAQLTINPNFALATGSARVYLGGPGGLSTFASQTILGDQVGCEFGDAVGTAGDVNGDGYADIVVGAPYYDFSGADRGEVLVYLGGPSGVATTPFWYEYGAQAGARFASSVTTAGDVDGDGLADVIVGSPYYANGESGEGQAAIFYGTRIGSTLISRWFVESNLTGAYFGSAVGTAGDVNGDGFSDVVVGSPYYSNGQSGEGRAQVFLGAGEVPYPSAALSLNGGMSQSVLGWSVSSADVNGDGYSDLIVGEPLYDTVSNADEGRVQVFFGGPTGPDAVADFSATGGLAGANLGISVGSAGDVNGDGYEDVIAGAHQYAGHGRAFIWFGGSSGLSTGYVQTLDGPAGSYFGGSVAGAGDVNGDGYADVVVGATGYVNGESGEGAAYVYLGGPAGVNATPHRIYEGNQTGANMGVSVAGAGDVNGDGYSDVIVGADLIDQIISQFPPLSWPDAGEVFAFYGGPGGLPASANWVGGGNASFPQFGHSVSTAGDVDGDGYADIVVGANNYSSGEGAAYVFRGGASGLSASPYWSRTGGQASANFGSSVTFAGDVNGDGLSDVSIGAVFFDNGQQDEGTVSVFGGPLSGPSATTPLRVLEGNSAFANLGHAVGFGGDVNGDGFSDVFAGAPGFSDLAYRQGQARLFYGNLRFNGTDALPKAPLMRHAGTSQPYALLDRTSGGGSFDVSAIATTAAGRGRVRLEWEVKPLGTAFSFGGVGRGSWQSSGSPGAPVRLAANVGAAPALLMHWRARVTTHSPFFPHSPWYSPQGNGAQQTDLRVGTSLTAIGGGTPPPPASALQVRAIPNPFNPRTVIEWSLPRAGMLSVRIYDPRGREIAVLREGPAEAGPGSVEWDGRSVAGEPVPSGVYLARVSGAGETAVRKLMLVR
jgi:hypothetical protein